MVSSQIVIWFKQQLSAVYVQRRKMHKSLYRHQKLKYDTQDCICFSTLSSFWKFAPSKLRCHWLLQRAVWQAKAPFEWVRRLDSSDGKCSSDQKNCGPPLTRPRPRGVWRDFGCREMLQVELLSEICRRQRVTASWFVRHHRQHWPLCRTQLTSNFATQEAMVKALSALRCPGRSVNVPSNLIECQPSKAALVTTMDGWDR